MNDQIIQILNYYLPSWITRKGGLLKILTKNSQGVIGKFPISINRNKSVCNNADYINLLPDSREKAISFIRINDIEFLESFGFIDAEVNMSINVWVNTDKINPVLETEDLMLDIIKSIPDKIANSGNLCKIMTELISSSRGNIYSDSTIKEEDKQFLMLPYDSFTLTYKINFSFRKQCIGDIILNPNNC